MAAPPTRVDEDVYRSAEAEAKKMSRSTAQQLSHWARIGRQFEATPNVSLAEIQAVLDGDASYDNLNGAEQAVVRAQWDAGIRDRRASLNYAERFAKEGRAYSELDERGRAVRRQPRARRAKA